MTPPAVRPATRRDVAAIARLRVAVWRAAYAALVPAEVLAGLDAGRDAERRAADWDERHADPRTVELVAEADGGVVVGWAAYGPARDPERGADGELYALYAASERWSTGVGHELLVRCEADLRAAGFASAYLWVLEGNERAASFYERHGWIEDGGVLVDDRTLGTLAYRLIERRRVRDLARVVRPS